MKKILISFSFLLCYISPSIAQTQRWWGYYNDGVSTTSMGTETAETYTCGAQFSGSQALLSGATLHGVRFYLRDKTNVSDVKIWLSTVQPANASAANVQVVNVSQEQLYDIEHDQRMLEVPLPQPYSVNGTVYVGYEFKIGNAKSEADKHPVVTTGKGTGASAGFWIRSSKTLLSWNNLSASYGSLAMQLLVSNPSMPQNAVYMPELNRQVLLGGSHAKLSVVIASEGFVPVSSVDYVVSHDGQPLSAGHYALPSVLWSPGSYADLPIEIDVPLTSGCGSLDVQVSQVNGLPNESSHSKVSSQLAVVDQLAHRRSVVEEYTGTWCVNCPRGIIGMENLSQQFGDDFIGIAVHVNNGAQHDPMYLSTYSPLIPSSAPRCQMDRSLWCDPYLGVSASDYHFHANEAFAAMLSQGSEADLKILSEWADEAQTKLNVTANTTFYLNSQNDDYALAFVLTEDGLRGSTKDWWQANGESGRNTYPDADMERFRNAPDPVTDITYQHVAVAALSPANGISGSIQLPIVSGQTQAFSTLFDLSANTLIQNKQHLNVCALLINKTTGQLVNAAQAPAGTSSFVKNITALKQQDVSWFTLDGRKTHQPSRPGIYLNNRKKIIIK